MAVHHHNDIGDIRITFWNVKGLSGSIPYLSKLLNHSDIMVIQEHHLYQCELNKMYNVHDEFDVFCRSSERLHNHNVHVHSKIGYCGLAIMWRHTLS